MEENYVDKIKKGTDEYPIKDTTSGFIGADDQGTIASGDTGWVSGGDVYTAIGNVESLLAAL